MAWITDRRADRTVGNDGWIEHFDVEMLLRPMFEVFDRNKDGLILRAEREECSQILGNSLSIHPSASPDCLAMDWKQLPSNESELPAVCGLASQLAREMRHSEQSAAKIAAWLAFVAVLRSPCSSFAGPSM